MDKKIENKILQLQPNKQLLFGISCVKRMEASLINYLINKEEAQSSFIVNKLIDKIFFNCTFEHFKQIYNVISTKNNDFIEELIPDTDDDGSNEAVLAQNTSIALAYCFDFIKENNSKFIDYCSQKAVDSVDVIALGILNLKSSDLLISKELAIQNQLLDIINDMKKNFDSTDIDKFKQTISRFKIE